MQIKSVTTFYDSVDGKMRKYMGTPTIVVSTVTTGTKERTAKENYNIFNVQRNKYYRNPFFITDRERDDIQAIWRTAIGKFMRPHNNSYQPLLVGAKDVGEKIIEYIRRHILDGHSIGGRKMKKLKEYIAQRKKAKHRGKELPILIDSGQCFKSLGFVIKKVFR